MLACASCGEETEPGADVCGRCGAALSGGDESRAATASDDVETQPWFMKVFSERMLISLCVVMVIGMIAATTYAFANSGADGLPVTIGTAPIQSSPSNAQTIGAVVPYSYVEVPLIECSTTFPNADDVALSMPSRVNEDVPTSLASHVAVYTDALGDMKVLGPLGWTCSAAVASDGSSYVDVFPASERIDPKDDFSTPLGNLPAGSPDREIYARQTSACVSCAETDACPVFTLAARDLARTAGWSCPGEAPATEALTKLSPSVYEIVDPSNVVGDGYPSGGLNGVYAVMTYRPHDPKGTWEDSCLLPYTEDTYCLASLNNFVAAYGNN